MKGKCKLRGLKREKYETNLGLVVQRVEAATGEFEGGVEGCVCDKGDRRLGLTRNSGSVILQIIRTKCPMSHSKVDCTKKPLDVSTVLPSTRERNAHSNKDAVTAPWISVPASREVTEFEKRAWLESISFCAWQGTWDVSSPAMSASAAMGTRAGSRLQRAHVSSLCRTGNLTNVLWVDFGAKGSPATERSVSSNAFAVGN